MQDEPIESTPLDTAPAIPVTPLLKIVPPSIPAEDMPEPDNAETTASPAWANDLRTLYNSVVEEPLPDSLIDLLSQLDAED